MEWQTSPEPKVIKRDLGKYELDDGMTIDYLIIQLNEFKDMAKSGETVYLVKCFYDNSISFSARRYETQDEIDQRIKLWTDHQNYLMKKKKDLELKELKRLKKKYND